MLLRVLCVGVALVLPGAASAAEPPRAPCESPGHLLAAEGGTALTTTPEGDYRGLHACARGGRTSWIGRGGETPTVHAIGAPYVAAGWYECERGDQCYGTASLLDARTGRTNQTPVGGRVRRVVASDAGSAAFGVRRFSAVGGGSEIHLLAADDTHTVLASGTGVVAVSLALAGQRLFWMEDGQVRSVVAASGPVRGERYPRGEPPAGRAEAPCASPGRLVTSTPRVAVTREPQGPRAGYHACLRGGRSWLVGDLDPAIGAFDSPPIPPRVAGRFVAYPFTFPDPELPWPMVGLRDLRSGRFAQAGFSPSQLHRLAVSSRGFVVAGLTPSSARGFGPRVLVLHVDGRVEELDDAVGVEPDTVAVAGGRVYWMRDGVAQTRVVSPTSPPG